MTMQPSNQPLSEDRLRYITEPPPLVHNDKRARKELDAYFNEQLRKERLKDVINWLFIFFIITAAAVATLGIAIRLLHLILPESNKWLTEEQIQGIDKLFFSGAIGGLLTSYFKKSNESKEIFHLFPFRPIRHFTLHHSRHGPVQIFIIADAHLVPLPHK